MVVFSGSLSPSGRAARHQPGGVHCGSRPHRRSLCAAARPAKQPAPALSLGRAARPHGPAAAAHVSASSPMGHDPIAPGLRCPGPRLAPLRPPAMMRRVTLHRTITADDLLPPPVSSAACAPQCVCTAHARGCAPPPPRGGGGRGWAGLTGSVGAGGGGGGAVNPFDYMPLLSFCLVVVWFCFPVAFWKMGSNLSCQCPGRKQNTR